MDLSNKEKFVEQFVKGFIDGHDLEEWNPEEIEEKINEVTGYAKAQFDMFKIMECSNEKAQV